MTQTIGLLLMLLLSFAIFVVNCHSKSPAPSGLVLGQSSRSPIHEIALSCRGGASPASTIRRLLSKVWKLVTGVVGRPPKRYFQSKKATAARMKRKPSGGADKGLARIRREAESFLQRPPDCLKLEVDSSDPRKWTVVVTGARGTPYDGETYRLRMSFPSDYPTRPPAVYFLKPVPKHQHVYSNGDICLNLLGKDWRPILSGEALALSILSMLSSAREKSSPQGGAMLADTPPGQQQVDWMYHDDRC